MFKKPFAHSQNMWGLLVKTENIHIFFVQEYAQLPSPKGIRREIIFRAGPKPEQPEMGRISVPALSNKGSA